MPNGNTVKHGWILLLFVPLYITELFYLLDKPYKAENSDEELKAYLHELSDKGPETVIITSIPVQGDPRKTSVYAYNRSSNRYWKVTCPYLPAHYPGTGDKIGRASCRERV